MNVGRKQAGKGEAGVPDAETGADLLDVLAELRDIAAKLDRLSTQLREPRRSRLAMRIGEASHGVHRAVIALDDPPVLQN
jgi:hypothetical protein